MDIIRIQFTLFSAFYAPLIATMSGGFLKEQGLEANWDVAPAGTSAVRSLENGTVDVVQSALSQSFSVLAAGETPQFKHFAQVNEMDGFFITGREPEANFEWKNLEGSEVILFSGGQPLVMFKYACHKVGIDFSKIEIINVGGAADMDAAFRSGKGRYIQQQGPFPQQLVADGLGHIVAQVGPIVGQCGFSSLAARPEWLESEQAQAFMRAYIKTRDYMNDEQASEIAKAQKDYFPNIDPAVLTDCIATYQKLGTWSRHCDITPPAYEATLDIFEYGGGLEERYSYDQVCSRPSQLA